MSKLPGFGGYFLIEAGEGVMTSINLFETSDQAHESTRVAATWIREEKLETALRTRRRSPPAKWSCTRRTERSRRNSLEAASMSAVRSRFPIKERTSK